MSTTYKATVFSMLLSFFYLPVDAQMGLHSEEDSLPINSSIRYGQLTNGFIYFLKQLDVNSSELSLRLFHKAGNSQEDEDQFDIAHAVEHLAFKETKNFPTGIRNDERIKKLNIGMYDYNAANGHNGTSYYFNAPFQNFEILDVAFLWFKDIINGLELSEEEIDQVRGELSQEILLRNGENLNDYLADAKLRALMFSCSNFKTDFLEYIRSFRPEIVRRFYHDWYRPNLMAISVVGNINDMDLMENKIKENFKDLTLTENPRKLRDCDAEYYSRRSQFHIVKRPVDTLKVLQNNEVTTHLVFRDPITNANLHTMKGQERLLLSQLFTFVMNQRFREESNKYKSFRANVYSPFRSYGFSPSLGILVRSENGLEKKALNRTFKLLHQLRTLGVTENEWQRVKEDQLLSLKAIDTSSANFWHKELQRYFFNEEGFLNDKYKLMINRLNDLTVEEFNQFLQDFLLKEPEDIGIIAPVGSKALSYTEIEVRSNFQDAIRDTVLPYEEPEVLETIMSEQDIDGLNHMKYTEKVLGSSGSIEVLLENGVKVVFKELEPLENDSSGIRIHGYSLKGADYYPEEHYYSALNAPSIVRNAGINNINKFNLRRFLSERTSIRPGSIFPYITDKEAGIIGESNLQDLEILLQLIYLSFTRPNEDIVAYEDWKGQVQNSFRKPSYTMDIMDFNNAVKEILGERAGHTILGKRLLQGTARFEGAQQVSLDDAMVIYKEIFGNAKNFKFLIRGDFKTTDILPLVQKYLGNLPSGAVTSKQPPRVEEGKLPTGPLMIEIPTPEYYRTENMIYGFRFIHETEDTFNWKEQLRVEALGGIANTKALGLRFEKGYSLYLIGVGGKFNWDANRYEIASSFNCLPQEYEALRIEFQRIFSEIKSGKISEAEFSQGLERLYYKNDATRAKIPWVIDEKLYNHYRYGQPWLNPLEVQAFVKSLTIEDIVNTANKYFSEDHFFEFIMGNNGL